MELVEEEEDGAGFGGAVEMDGRIDGWMERGKTLQQ